LSTWVVSVTPDEPRAQGDGLEALARRLPHGLLGFGLGRRVRGPRVRPQWRRLIDLNKWLAGHQRRLGAAVDEAPHAGLFAGGQHVPGANHVATLEFLPPSPLTEVGGEVEGDVGSIGAGRERCRVAELAPDRLRPQGGDALRGLI
jgi:hypothetical protein